MSELPPNIDAILASIRSRMNEDGQAPPPEPAPTPFPTPLEIEPPVVASVGAISLVGSEMTLDGLIRAMLEPMLKTWLDANMPEIVERMAQAEIKRLTGRD